MTNLTNTWKTSSFCNADQPMCVEVAHVDGAVMVRDTAGYHLNYTPDEWAAFVQGVKAGEFDI